MRFEEPVLLYGAGREALSTRAFLQARQPDLRVFVTVDSGTSNIPETEAIEPADLPQAIRDHRFGYIIKSPGVSRYKPIFEIAKAAGIAVTSNLNLWGSTYRDARLVIAITGTKGKSTTTTLTHLMLTHSGVDAGLAGNVGLAPVEIADRYPVVIFELSSYQTADMSFLPDVAAVTNLYPEHVDWHGNVERYYRDKLHLIDREGQFRVGLGATAHNNAQVLKALRHPERLLPELSASEITAINDGVAGSRLKGQHNLENARLAAQLALAAGASLNGILEGISAFRPLPHRLEEHRFGGKTFVNDSISTTPEATKAALAAYQGQRIALIAGGHEREQDYTELAGLLTGYGVTIVACLPVTGARLATAARQLAPTIAVLPEPDLQAALNSLFQRRDEFDAVILSPGAPSYNQFKNFEERGRLFVEYAQVLFGNPE